MTVEGTKTFGAGSMIEEANQNGTKGTPSVRKPMAAWKIAQLLVLPYREKNQDSVI